MCVSFAVYVGFAGFFLANGVKVVERVERAGQSLGGVPTWYQNNVALSWANMQMKCTERGQRFCTYSELCPGGPGKDPYAGKQSSTDAWAPVLEDDKQTPNYIHVGVHWAHFPCKKLTYSHALDAHSWPFGDERADLKDTYACCSSPPKGYTMMGAGSCADANDKEYEAWSGPVPQQGAADVGECAKLCNRFMNCVGFDYTPNWGATTHNCEVRFSEGSIPSEWPATETGYTMYGPWTEDSWGLVGRGEVANVKITGQEPERTCYKKDSYFEVMDFFGKGCCRFTGWRAKSAGMQTEQGCNDACLLDPDCIAADTARPRGEKFECFLFSGKGENFRTECDVLSSTEKCFVKSASSK